jgi:hypothetical protein
MSFGNMPLDGGNLLISDEEKEEFLQNELMAEKYILLLISAREFLNGKKMARGYKSKRVKRYAFGDGESCKC